MSLNNLNSKNKEEDQKKNNIDNKNKFISDFCSYKIANSTTSDFVDDIFTKSTFNSDIQKELIDFIELDTIIDLGNSKNKKEYLGVDVNKITTTNFRSILLKEKIKQDRYKKTILDEISGEYDIIDNKEFNKIEKHIDKFSSTKLSNLILSHNYNNRRTLLGDIFDTIPTTKKLVTNFYQLINKITNISERKELIKNKLKNDNDFLKFNESLDNIIKLKNNHHDLKTLLNNDFFNEKEKKVILDTFLPKITLKEALKIGAIKNKDADNYKKKILNSYKEKYKVEFDIKLLQDQDIILDTKEDFIDLNKILKNKNLVKLDLSVEKNNQESSSDLELNRDDFIEKLNGINSNNRFKNLNKFVEGNIMEFIKIDENNHKQIIYYKISNFDNQEVTYKQIGSGDGVYNSISLKDEKKDIKTTSYNNFLFLLKQSSISLDFKTTNDIKNEIEQGSIVSSDFDFLTDDESENMTDQEKNKNNKNKFINIIDSLDPKSKEIGFKKGIYFESKSNIFYIDGFDDGIVTLVNPYDGSSENITFDDFLIEFKNQKAKRIKKIENFEELILGFENDESKWKNHKILNGTLIAKSVGFEGDESDQEVDFLIGDKTDEVIKINNISGNQVSIQFGERKDFEDLSDKEKKSSKIDEDDKGEKIYLDDKEYTISLNELNNLITKNKFYPNWETGKTITEPNVEEEQNDFHSSFLSRLLNRHSLKELLAGSKMFLEGIEESLKKGNDLHAAEFAMKLGKFLPAELAEEMKIKVETAQSSEQDKELEKLGKVDSYIAVERIEGWLHNRDTPEYKKEAGLLFMLDKYGHLTAKKALYEYRGKWLWYEALGGRKNDSLFLQVKKESEQDNITFTEEYLVHMLLKRQCGGRMPPKRRSRLHKEFEGKWKAGITAEFDKGYGDAEKKRTEKAMLKGGMDEAMGGTTSNAIGWFKKVIERGGSLEDMTEGFFNLLFSGSLYNIDQATFLKIKALWEGNGMPIIPIMFSTTKTDMLLFNKTILLLSKKIEESYPNKHKGITSQAQSLYDDALSGKGSEKSRLMRAQNFWKEHGTPLSRSLNMVNSEDTQYSKIDKIVFFEKDNNPVLNQYYDKVKVVSNMGNAFGKEFMSDACGQVGLTGLDINSLTKKHLKYSVGGALQDEGSGKPIFNEIIKDIESVKNKLFVGDDINSDENKKAQKKYLLHILKDFFSALISNHGTNANAFKGLNSPNSMIGQRLNAWKINIKDDLGDFSDDVILGNTGTKQQQQQSEEIILEVVNRILEGETGDAGNIFDPLQNVQEDSKKQVENITEYDELEFEEGME